MLEKTISGAYVAEATEALDRLTIAEGAEISTAPGRS